MIHLALLAAVVALPQGNPGRAAKPGAAVDPRDTVALFRRAGDAERSLLAQWYAAWRASETKRALNTDERLAKGLRKPELLISVNPRQSDLSCALDDLTYVPDHAWGLEPKLRRIASINTPLGVCPNWLPPIDGYFGPPKVPDERLGIDGALDPELRQAIADVRRDVIALMDSAVVAMPGNTTVVGQLVRLLVDQGELPRAWKAVRECKALEYWCGALAGYVLAQRGEIRSADSAYATSAAWLREEDRCTWTDASALLDSAARDAYIAMPCPQRLAFDRRLWWLADPLWSVPGNDRRAEQATRQLTVIVHAATQRDERYNWTAPFGGDALEQAIKRYGWPTYAAYGRSTAAGLPAMKEILNMSNRASNAGSQARAAAAKGGAAGGSSGGLFGGAPRPVIGAGAWKPGPAGLVDAQFGFPAGGPGVEGGRARNVTIESFWANIVSNSGGFISGPLYLAETIATTPPPSIGSTLEYSLDRVHPVPAWNALQDPFNARPTDWTLNAPRDTVEVRNWWPREHYAPAHAIVQFTDQQTALLRREGNSLLAFSTSLALTDLRRHAGDSVDANLLLSSSPDTISLVATRRRGATDRLVFFQPLPDRPSVVSVEIPWDSSGRAAGQSRFGVTPPVPLARLRKGQLAISDPVFLLAPPGARELPNDADAAIPLMLGSTTLAVGTSKVGVYWETYGFTDTDTVEISLRVQRQTPMTLLQRAGAVTGISENVNTPVTMSWKEPQAGRNTRFLAGAVPIQMRSLVLDISALRDGDYVLDIGASRPGQPGVHSQRAFVIR